MRVSELPSPGFLSNAARLRTEAAKAISTVQIQDARSGGVGSSNASGLAAFFTACSAAVTDVTPTTPVISTAVATSATTLKLSFNVAMDETVKPAAAAFASTGNTITATAWGTGGDAGKLILTGTGFAASDSLVYTKPATNFLRSIVGDAVATETQAIT
jgi:hypothetical protein